MNIKGCYELYEVEVKKMLAMVCWKGKAHAPYCSQLELLTCVRGTYPMYLIITDNVPFTSQPLDPE